MDHNMFCFQCEQTAGCTGCTSRGVCGKDAQTAQAQDRLTGSIQKREAFFMKKMFLLLALVCVLVLLAACGSKPAPTEPAPTEPTSSRDLQMLYQSGITAMGADAPVLFPVSDISELSPLFPGLEEISFRQVSGGLSPVTGAPDEVVLLEVENSADVQKVVDILQKAVDEGAVESEGTDEAITAAWKDNASITTDGNYICLAVFMNGVSIPAEFMLP